MAEHSPFEIEDAWEEIVVTSRYGDKAHYRVNSLTRHVLVKTRVGDGNAAAWRNTNITYESVMGQPHEKVVPESATPVVSPPRNKKALA